MESDASVPGRLRLNRWELAPDCDWRTQSQTWATQSGAQNLEGNHLRLRRGKENNVMRSDLIFGALTHVNNRYQLCQLASKATRKLHKPNTRLQDTTNEVLDRFRETIPMNVEAGEPLVEKVQLQERRAA